MGFSYCTAKTRGKFCSNRCQADYVQTTVTDRRVEAGEVRQQETLRRYLIRKRGPNCEECGEPPVWNGKPLKMQVDHIDGDSDNRFPSNLRLLCPNCHSQTPSWCGRAKKDTTRNAYLRRYRNRKLNGDDGGR